MSDAKEPTASEDAGFESFSLDPRIQEAIARLGFKEPTPIQRETIPPILAGRDIIGRARTGSGKTAAFGLPLLEKVKDSKPGVKALVLAPTRELALQVTDAIRSYGTGLRVQMVTIYGGAAYGPQFSALKRGVPIVVGTPGRVIDHLDRKSLDLSGLELLVLDEADEMLRMGFIDDVTRVLDESPDTRQVALFSATMPTQIQKVASKYLRDPLEIQVESGALATDHIEQRGMLVPHRFKLDALQRVLATEERDATLIFARTRAGCAQAAEELSARGITVEALHGDLNQGARERVVQRLRSGRIDVVVATDVAARGIDIDRITHVVNLDMPDDDEIYVHRIGRTGRAGRKGIAISLVTPRESWRMRSLEKTLRVRIEKVTVPTDADIDGRHRARLREKVLAARETEVAPGIASLLAELVDAAAQLDADLSQAESRGADDAVDQTEGETQGSAEGETQGSAEGETQGSAEGETQGSAEGEPQGSAESEPQGSADGETRTKTESDEVAQLRAIASAALRLLAEDTGIDLTGRASRNPPSWARSSRPERPAHRERDRGQRQDRQDRRPVSPQERGSTDQDGVDLFLPVGKARGVRPGDIVGALTNDLGVTREQIGRITILPHKTFLRVEADVANRVLEGRAELRLRGRGVPVTKAHTGEQPDRGPGPEKRPFAQGGKNPPVRTGGPARRFRPKNR